MHLELPLVVVLYPAEVAHPKERMNHAKEAVTRARRKKEKVLGIHEACSTLPVPQFHHRSP